MKKSVTFSYKMVDVKLSQVALKIKNLVVVDCSFPRSVFPEFKKIYEPRLIWTPCRWGMALEMAGGIASFGKLVVVFGLNYADLSRLDSTLNVKVLLPSPEGSWDGFEEKLRSFGPSTLLIPEGL